MNLRLKEEKETRNSLAQSGTPKYDGQAESSSRARFGTSGKTITVVKQGLQQLGPLLDQALVALSVTSCLFYS